MAKIDDILDKNSADIKKGLRKQFDLLMTEVLKSGVTNADAKRIVKERMKAVYSLNINNLAKGMKEAVGGSWSGADVEKMDVQGVKLSKRLYANIDKVERDTLSTIKTALKDGKSIKEVSKLLYEGYNFKVDPLDVKKKLPKYLKEDIKTMSAARINKIKTPALKAAYLDTLNAKSGQQLHKSLDRAFYERNRYFADRIAQTEIFKAHSEKVAREIMQDDTLEVVKIRLSRTHPVRDICDYHTGVDKYGLGKGVYPKAKAPRPPYHPHCRCAIIKIITKSAKNAKLNPKADTHFMDRLSRFEKSQILGSQIRVDDFLRSGSVLKSGYYDEPLSVGGVGYNAGMEKYKEIEKKFIDSLASFDSSTKDNAVSTFPLLWMSSKDYEKHYNKRMNTEKVVENRHDFVLKTFIALSSAEVFIETYELPELWDRVFYSKDDEWAVVIAKNGKILTSYRINSTISDTLNKHKKFLNAKIDKIGVSDEFTSKIDKITEQLRKL